eukprot:1804219-Rhodomonas_salina.1
MKGTLIVDSRVKFLPPTRCRAFGHTLHEETNPGHFNMRDFPTEEASGKIFRLIKICRLTCEGSRGSIYIPDASPRNPGNPT